MVNGYKVAARACHYSSCGLMETFTTGKAPVSWYQNSSIHLKKTLLVEEHTLILTTSYLFHDAKLYPTYTTMRYRWGLLCFLFSFFVVNSLTPHS